MKDIFSKERRECTQFPSSPALYNCAYRHRGRGKATRRARVFAVGADVCGNYAVLFVCI